VEDLKLSILIIVFLTNFAGPEFEQYESLKGVFQFLLLYSTIAKRTYMYWCSFNSYYCILVVCEALLSTHTSLSILIIVFRFAPGDSVGSAESALQHIFQFLLLYSCSARGMSPWSMEKSMGTDFQFLLLYSDEYDATSQSC